MSRSTLTVIVVFGVTTVLIAYDVWAAFVPGATISEVMLKMAHYHPIIPFALGILMGHFFWSQQAESSWMPTGASGAPRVSSSSYPQLLLWLGCFTLALGVVLVILDKR